MEKEKWTLELVLAALLALPGAFLGDGLSEVLICWACAITLFGILLGWLGRGDAIMSFMGSAILVLIPLLIRELLWLQ